MNAETSAIYVKGTILAEQGQLTESVVCYCKAIELNPDSDLIHGSLWVALCQTQHWDMAVASYHRALEVNPDSSLVYHHLGAALIFLEQWDNAVISLQRVIELNPLNPNWAGSYMLLANALSKLGKTEQAIAAYQQCLQLQPHYMEAVVSLQRLVELNPLNPNWAELYRFLEDSLSKLGQSEQADYFVYCQAVISLQHIIELNPLKPKRARSYRLLGDCLSKLGKLEQAIAAYQQCVELQPDYIVYCNMGSLLTISGKVNEAIVAYQQAELLRPDQVEIYWNLAWLFSQQNQWDKAVACYRKGCVVNPEFVNIDELKKNFSLTLRYVFIQLNCISHDETIFVEKIGLNINNLALIQQDNTAWARDTFNVFKYTPEQQLSQFKIPDFQRRILETSCINSFCPISGKALNSNQSFYIFYNENAVIFYRFVGLEEFYLIVIGSWSPLKAGIYFPSRELIISFCCLDWGNMFGVNRELIEEYVNIFKAHVFCQFEGFKNYILKEERKKLTALVGFCGNNIGHYFWNEISAIQELHETKTNHKLDAFLIGKNNYFDIRELFPEIIAENNETLFLNIPEKSVEEVFDLCLKNNLFVVKLIGLAITERLANRLYHSSLSKCSVNFLQKVGESKKHFPLVWITLRTHTRVWLSQVEGIVNIIKELSKDYPNLGVIFDGLSTEKDILEKIKNLIPVNIKTYNALDCAIYETIVWVHAIDLFITSYGAGLIFPCYIANQPGVVHTHSIWNKPKPYFLHPREKCVPIVPVPSVDSFDSAYAKGINRNYDVDWRDIYNEVVKIIDNLNKERTLTK